MVWVPQKVVSRRSDHYMQPGRRNFGIFSKCPDLLFTLNAHYIVHPAFGMRFRKFVQSRIGNGLADAALPSLRRLSNQKYLR